MGIKINPHNIIFTIASKLFPFHNYRFFRRLKHHICSVNDFVFPEHHKFLSRYVNGKIIVEVGVYKGTYTRFFLRSGAKQIYAFEPNPEVRRYAANNKRVKFYPFAAGKSFEVLDYYAPENELGTLDPRLMVAHESAIRLYPSVTVPLDEVDLPKIDFIKIDADGMDFEVLLGATHLIQRDRPIIFFEYWEKGLELRGYSEVSVLEFFVKRDYAITRIPDNGYENFFCVPNKT